MCYRVELVGHLSRAGIVLARHLVLGTGKRFGARVDILDAEFPGDGLELGRDLPARHVIEGLGHRSGNNFLLGETHRGCPFRPRPEPRPTALRQVQIARAKNPRTPNGYLVV